MSLEEIDARLSDGASKMLARGDGTIARTLAWSVIDGLRFVARPNPAPRSLGNAIEGTFGPLGRHRALAGWMWAALIALHLHQAAWFVAIAASLWIGFRHYGSAFVPGIVFASVFVPHLATDVFIRHGMPLEPWLLAGMALAFVPWVRGWKLNRAGLLTRCAVRP